MDAAKGREYLIVDGYNIIFAWEELKLKASSSLDDARNALLTILSDFQGFKGIEVIAVFDAHRVKDNIGSVLKHDSVTVVYTKEYESADNYIERCVYEMAKNNKVRVATSDGLEQIMVMGRGAIRISAMDLYYEIKAAKNEQKKGYIDKRPIKSNLLFDNLTEDMKILFEKMRRQKGD